MLASHALRWFVLLLVAATAAPAAASPLTVQQIFAKEPLTGRLPASIAWAPDGSRFLYTLPGGAAGPLETRVYDMRTHRSRVFFDASPNGRGSRPAPEFVWSPGGTQLAYLDAGALWTIGVAGGKPRRIAGDADDPQWSPDGSQIGFVHGNDLAVADVRTGAVRALSHDGTDLAGNASPDWVYSEELEMKHAFRWSPDGRWIAYLHVDDRPVSAFPILDSAPYHNRVEEQRYPNAGEANPIVTARVVRVADGATRTLYDTRRNDDYVSWIGFTGTNVPAAEIIDRAQTHRRIVDFAPALRTLYAQEDRTWIDRVDDPLLLDAHRLAIISRDDSTNDVRIIDTVHGGSRRVFSAIAIETLAAYDPHHDVLYATGSGPTRRDTTAFAIPLAGGASAASGDDARAAFDRDGGAHGYTFAPHGNAFVERISSLSVPPTVVAGTTADAPRITVARSRSIDALGFGKATLLSVPSEFGPLDAWMIVPPDFDPAKRYPVVTMVYGGPQAPTTRNEWGGFEYLFHQLLAQHGFIVFSIDGPGSQIDGTGARRVLYRALGPGALDGQLAGARYLRTLPYVDPDRIGIWGWSFGGFLTSFALTHAPDVWKAGFAVGTVSDWHRYDTIYTERYMGRPQQNARAYDDSSVMPAVARMHGWLMLAHGTADDNVHVANTFALATALTNSGRSFGLMLYPGKRHGIEGIPQRRDLFERMLRFWTDHLSPRA